MSQSTASATAYAYDDKPPLTTEQSFRTSTSSFMTTNRSYSTATSPDLDSSSYSFHTARSQTPSSPPLGYRVPLTGTGVSLPVTFNHSHSRQGSAFSRPDLRQDYTSRTSSVQSVPYDEDGTLSGRVTPTAAYDAYCQNGTVVSPNGFRVSLDKLQPASNRNTGYMNDSSTTAPASRAQESWNMLYYSKSDTSSVDSHDTMPTPTPAPRTALHQRRPLPLPGEPSPALAPLDTNNNWHRSIKQRRRESSLYGGEDEEKRWSQATLDARDVYGGLGSIPQEPDQGYEQGDDNGTASSLPLLKLDLDFGPSSLFDDLGSTFGLDFGSLSQSNNAMDNSTFGSPSSATSRSNDLTPTGSTSTTPPFFATPLRSNESTVQQRSPEATLAYASMSTSTSSNSRPLSTMSVASASTLKHAAHPMSLDEHVPTLPQSQSQSQSQSQTSLAEPISLPPAESVALPPSRPMSVLSMLDSVPAEPNMLQKADISSGQAATTYPVHSVHPSRSHSRMPSTSSEAGLSNKSPVLMTLPEPYQSDVYELGLKPTQPLSISSKRRGSLSSTVSLASMTHHRTGSKGSNVDFGSQSQSSLRLPSDFNHELNQGLRSASDSLASSNVNKQLPAPPAVAPSGVKRMLQRPSLPEYRSGSIRKTSIGAQSVAASLFNKGKGLVTRNQSSRQPIHEAARLGNETAESPEANSCFPKQHPPMHGRTGITSLFSRNHSDADRKLQQQQQPVEQRQNQDSRSSIESTSFVEPAKEPSRPVLAMRKSFDLLRDKLSTSTNTTSTAPSMEGHVGETGLAKHRTKQKEAKSESVRRPSTDQLLNLVSVKLAKIALERSATPSEGSVRSDLSSLASPTSTEASSTFQQSTEGEKYSVAQAVRINRSESANSDLSGALHVPSNSISDASAFQTAQLGSIGSTQPVRVAAKLVNKDEAIAMVNSETANPQVDLSAAAPVAPEQRSPPGHARELKSNASAPSAIKSPAPLTFSRPMKPPPLLWRKRSLPAAPPHLSSELTASWIQLHEAHHEYVQALTRGQTNRHEIVQASLLPFLKRAERGYEQTLSDLGQAQNQRQVLFDWLDTLSDELRDAPANRGTCLDGVAAILESCLLSASALDGDAVTQGHFHDSLVTVLDFAVQKLNEKAVYANTLSFAGRLFAIAFFRIPGVGTKLLRLLPQVKRQDLKRVLQEMNIGVLSPPPIRLDIFPKHLEELCFKDLTSYANLLTPLAPGENALLVESEEHAVRMHGNWLIRWQASDSDLPFAFYRAYHRQLAAYLQPPPSLADQPEGFLAPYEAIAAPGFLFLAASLLEKIDSLIHRNLRSVTTLGPNSGNFNAQDSANMSMGAKPKVLEHANRRVVSTVLDIIGGPARSLTEEENEPPEGLTRRQFFGGMLQVWLRAVVKRTSLFDARGVFLLLDFIEGLFYTVCTPIDQPENATWHPAADTLAMFDISFILSFIRIIFEKGDNIFAIMRCVTFLYSHFETFTLKPEHCFTTCQEILLHPDIFSRMFLFWNTSVRGYYLRLLVWKVSRLGLSPDGRPIEHKDQQTIAILQTLSTRLEGIRKRHDEIDPLDDLPDDDLFDSARSSINSTRGVANQPWIVGEFHQDADSRRVSTINTGGRNNDRFSAEPSPMATSLSDEKTPVIHDHHNATLDELPTPKLNQRDGLKQVVNWLKILKPGKKGQRPSKVSGGTIQPFEIDAPTSVPLPVAQPGAQDGAHTVSIDASRNHSNLGDAPVVTDLTEAEEQADEDPYTYMPKSPRAEGPTFFQFEFESNAAADDRRSRRASLKTIDRASVHGNSTPRRPQSVVQSPRVSKRFSKRASILPPPALDLLLESSEPVPQIPQQYRETEPYPLSQHCYAVRSLREYEDALDEYDVWIARLQESEEELEGREQGDLVPRLNVLWPLSFSED